ncbi:MAG TPA: alpha/beta hydrolase [Candidatus Limnocylindria bacterium]|nr:alpha/beta hydrolase [Candidatus Limnocylindria bacterium]
MKKALKRIGMVVLLSVWCAIAVRAGAPLSGASEKRPPGTKSGFITTTDGVKIHYLEAGRQKSFPSAEVGNPLPAGTVATKGNIAVTNPSQFPTVLFVPGWTMPAWIWEKQLAFFSKDYRVVAMDPRSQGDSTQTPEGLYPAARARDIKAVVNQLHLAPVVLVGWSMAVNELLAYVDQFGTGDLAALVLVDDEGGVQTPAEANEALEFIGKIQRDRQTVVPEFIRTQFFKKPQPPGYVDRVIDSSLRVPSNSAVALLVGKFSSDYRSALPKIDKPTIVCAAKSPYVQGIIEMQKKIPRSQLEMFDDAGHALFVDDADKFNAMLEDFLHDLLLR